MNGTRTLRPQALATLLGKCTAALLALLWLAGCALPAGAPADAAKSSPSQASVAQKAALSTPLGPPTEAPCPPACTPSAAPQPTPLATVPADPRITTDPRVTRLLDELEQHGASFTLEGPSQAAFLAPVPGAAYNGSTGRLYLHVFTNANAAAQRAAEISGELGPQRSLIDWVGEPHFYRCDSLLALYLGKDSQTLTALSEICGPEFAKEPLPPTATPG